MLTWTDALALGHETIDHDHRECVEMMNKIALADDQALPVEFAALARHLHEHFARENELMRTTDFPARACHEGEHERVLALVNGILDDIAAGRFASARHFASKAGPSWFLDHRSTMDFVTVTYARNVSER